MASKNSTSAVSCCLFNLQIGFTDIFQSRRPVALVELKPTLTKNETALKSRVSCTVHLRNRRLPRTWGTRTWADFGSYNSVFPFWRSSKSTSRIALAPPKILLDLLRNLAALETKLPEDLDEAVQEYTAHPESSDP